MAFWGGGAWRNDSGAQDGHMAGGGIRLLPNRVQCRHSRQRSLMAGVPSGCRGAKGCSSVAHSRVVSVVCGDFSGELAVYDPSEMSAAGLGHVAVGVIGRWGMATSEPNCNGRRLHEEAAVAGLCDASLLVRKPHRRQWTFRGNFDGDQEAPL